MAVEQPTLDRVERLLALLLLQQMKGASQGEKAMQLNRAGFSNTEIADLQQAHRFDPLIRGS